MEYSITREELVKLIENAELPAIKEILENHLEVFDGGVANCAACTIEDEPELEEVPEEDEDE